MPAPIAGLMLKVPLRSVKNAVNVEVALMVILTSIAA